MPTQSSFRRFEAIDVEAASELAASSDFSVSQANGLKQIFFVVGLQQKLFLELDPTMSVFAFLPVVFYKNVFEFLDLVIFCKNILNTPTW